MDKEELMKFALGLLAKSDISDEDFAMWQNHLNVANKDMLKMITGTLSKGGEVIVMTTKSLKEKMATEGNTEKLHKVIEAEKTEIKNILNEA